MLKKGDKVVIRVKNDNYYETYKVGTITELDEFYNYNYFLKHRHEMQSLKLSFDSITEIIVREFQEKHMKGFLSEPYYYICTVTVPEEKQDYLCASWKTNAVNAYIVQIPSFICLLYTSGLNLVDRLSVISKLLNDQDLNKPDDVGNTVLHMEKILENKELTEQLILFGSKNSINKKGLTPYDIALLSGNVETAEMISSYFLYSKQDSTQKSGCKNDLSLSIILNNILNCILPNQETRLLVKAIERINSAKHEAFHPDVVQMMVEMKKRAVIRAYPYKTILPYYLNAINTEIQNQVVKQTCSNLVDIFTLMTEPNGVILPVILSKIQTTDISEKRVFLKQLCCFKETPTNTAIITSCLKETSLIFDSLLDQDPAIQISAACLAERYLGITLAEFYTSHLSDKNPSIAIRGIKRFGDKNSGRFLMLHIDEFSDNTLVEVIRAISAIMKDEASTTYWRVLQYAASNKIAKAACKAIAENNCLSDGSFESIESLFGMEAAKRYLYSNHK